MPRHRGLNRKKFIESVPDHLLREYFAKKCEGEVALASCDYESVNGFLDKMGDPDLRDSVLEDFTHINDICETAMNILVHAAQRYGVEMTGEEERQELAMDMFLHHRQAFEYAYDLYCLYNASSKMSQHSIEAQDFEVTPDRIEAFKQRVGAFYSEQAKGKECIVRCYDEDGRVVIVVIRGSYKRSVAVWDGQEIKTQFFRPAKEDVLQFDKPTRVLSIKAPYKKDKDNYIDTFTEAIVGDKSRAQSFLRDDAYTLKPLQKGTFSFAGNDVITSVTLVEVKLSVRGLSNPEVVIKSSDVLKTLENDLRGISLNSGELVHAKFLFELQVDGKTRKVRFAITPPNVTDLTTKKYADVIGAYLRQNGVKLV